MRPGRIGGGFGNGRSSQQHRVVDCRVGSLAGLQARLMGAVQMDKRTHVRHVAAIAGWLLYGRTAGASAICRGLAGGIVESWNRGIVADGGSPVEGRAKRVV